MKKFLLFDFLITPWIIRIFYWIMQIVIIISGFGAMFAANKYGGSYGFGMMGPLYGLMILIGGSLLLRIVCEAIMVQFKIAENTSQLKETFKVQEKSEQ